VKFGSGTARRLRCLSQVPRYTSPSNIYVLQPESLGYFSGAWLPASSGDLSRTTLPLHMQSRVSRLSRAYSALFTATKPAAPSQYERLLFVRGPRIHRSDNMAERSSPGRAQRNLRCCGQALSCQQLTNASASMQAHTNAPPVPTSRSLSASHLTVVYRNR
jgi:hypothetical protein